MKGPGRKETLAALALRCVSTVPRRPPASPKGGPVQQRKLKATNDLPRRFRVASGPKGAGNKPHPGTRTGPNLLTPQQLTADAPTGKNRRDNAKQCPRTPVVTAQPNGAKGLVMIPRHEERIPLRSSRMIGYAMPSFTAHPRQLAEVFQRVFHVRHCHAALPTFVVAAGHPPDTAGRAGLLNCAPSRGCGFKSHAFRCGIDLGPHHLGLARNAKNATRTPTATRTAPAAEPTTAPGVNGKWRETLLPRW